MRRLLAKRSGGFGKKAREAQEQVEDVTGIKAAADKLRASSEHVRELAAQG